MTSQNADASKSKEEMSEDIDIEARIVQLHEGIAKFSLELARCDAAQVDYRAKEDPIEQISFAKEIFECQQDTLRLRVEIELLEKKIRRLELGYAEGGVVASPDQDPLF